MNTRVAICVLVPLCLGVVLNVAAHETLTTTVLFDREIVRVLNKHCVSCHNENGPSSPFETYEQAWLQGRKIRSEIIARHMPPWPAVPGYGQFANDNSLTLRETQFMVSWVEGLGPRNSGTVFTNVIDTSGKPREAVRAKAEFGRWQLGQPNITAQFKNNVADPGLKAPARIRAIEYMPANRRSVHAAFFKVQETGQWIGAWTPWYGFIELPAGAAFQLPAGAHIVSDTADAGTLGLFLADKPTPNAIADLVVNAKTTLATDIHAVALRLEISKEVKSVEVSTRRPDGGTDVLLFAKDFQPDWPTPYIFKEPVLLKRGSVLSITANGGTARATLSKY
jgi:hypothetical protein